MDDQDFPLSLRCTELARRAGVTRQTLGNWQRAGAIPAGQVVNGRMTTFDAAAVVATLGYAKAQR